MGRFLGGKGSNVGPGPADMRKVLCLAMYISVLELGIPGSFGIFVRPLVR